MKFYHMTLIFCKVPCLRRSSKTSLIIFMVFCSSFSSCFRCKVRLSIWRFSCFLRKDDIAINFPSRAVLLHPTSFKLSCFQCYNSNTIRPQETRKTLKRLPNFTPKTPGKTITTTTTKIGHWKMNSPSWYMPNMLPEISRNNSRKNEETEPKQKNT